MSEFDNVREIITKPFDFNQWLVDTYPDPENRKYFEKMFEKIYSNSIEPKIDPEIEKISTWFDQGFPDHDIKKRFMTMLTHNLSED